MFLWTVSNVSFHDQLTLASGSVLRHYAMVEGSWWRQEKCSPHGSKETKLKKRGLNPRHTPRAWPCPTSNLTMLPAWASLAHRSSGCIKIQSTAYCQALYKPDTAHKSPNQVTTQDCYSNTWHFLKVLFLCVCVCGHMPVCAGQKSNSGVFLYHMLSYFWDRDFPWTWSSPVWLDWLASKSLDSTSMVLGLQVGAPTLCRSQVSP